MVDLFNPETLVGVEGENASYIGHRVSISLQEIEIPYKWAEENLADLGLERFIPRKPNPADVFRRITGKIAGDITHEDDTKTRVLVVPVTERQTDGDIMERVVMIVNIDRRNREVTDGLKVARILFDRETEQLSVSYGPFGEFHYCPEEVRDIIQEALGNYDRQINLLSFQQVRDMVNNILATAGNPVWHKRKTNPPKVGIQIKAQYNIPATREYLVFALEDLAERLNAYADDKEAEQPFGIDVLPVMNTAKNKENLALDALYFATTKLEKMLNDERVNIIKAQDTEKATIKAKERFQVEASKTMKLIEEYEMLLGKSMEEVRIARERATNKLHRFCSSPVEQAELRSEIKLTRRIRRMDKVEAEKQTETMKTDVPRRLIRAASPTEFQGAIF